MKNAPVDEHPETGDRVSVRTSGRVVHASDVDREDAAGAHGGHGRDLQSEARGGRRG